MNQIFHTREPSFLCENALTHLVAELPHIQVKISGVRQVKKMSRVRLGAMPVNTLTREIVKFFS